MHKRPEERRFLTHTTENPLCVGQELPSYQDVEQIARSVPCFVIGNAVHSSMVADVFQAVNRA